MKNKVLHNVQRHFPNVEEVSDSKKTVEIQVTKRDVSTAARKDHGGCAFAVACKRQQGADGVIIGLKSSYIIKGKKAVRFITSSLVQREIVSFDRSGVFEPGQYYKLSKVSPCYKIGANKSAKGMKPGPRKGKAAPVKAVHRQSTENIRVTQH